MTICLPSMNLATIGSRTMNISVIKYQQSILVIYTCQKTYMKRNLLHYMKVKELVEEFSPTYIDCDA